MRLSLLLLLAIPIRAQVDEARLLWAIGQVESGGNSAALGRSGERGATQMLPAMRRACRTPISLLRRLEAELQRAGMPVNPYTLALIWHLGYPKIARRQISDDAADYADRVRNVYESSPPH